MRLPRTAEFDEECERFAFAFTCESCAHFDARKDACRHGYPTEEHRLAFYRQARGEIVFCKEFELR